MPRKHIDAHIRQLEKFEPLSEKDVIVVCKRAKLIFEKDSNIIDVKAPVTIAGDIHGQFVDLLELFRIGGKLPNTRYLFLGDYVDRGYYSLETITYLFCLKIKYPDHIFIIRGNHECRAVTRVYGFYDECMRKYGNAKPWTYFVALFDFLPLAALVENKIFCAHGGIAQSFPKLDDIRKQNRVKETPQDGGMADMLWSDPTNRKGFGPSPRGCGHVFGPDMTQKFLRSNSLYLIARAHQLTMKGYAWFHRKSVCTIFSAPNYIYRCGNLASIMVVEEHLHYKFVQFPAAPRESHPDNIPKMREKYYN